MNKHSVILVRVLNGIGIDDKLNGFTLDGTPVKRKFYNCRLCYVHNGKRVGYNSLKNSPKVTHVIKFDVPF